MNLFYAPEIIPPRHVLSPEESRHAVAVLRLGAGSRLHLVDGRGGLSGAEVVVPSSRACEVRVIESFPEYGRRPYRIVTAVAPTKNSERFEWFLEKATETGLDAVVPIECANRERRAFNAGRAEKVLISAMKQSLKAYLPVLEPLTPVGELLARPLAGVKLIAHCRSEDFGAVRVPITEALPPRTYALILIGPEGDFTAGEVSAALRNGYIPVSLGRSRLRTETAALVAVAAAYLKNME
jgi:16S rRNA (uracil1498-N3)-methyltransferase